MAPAFTWWLTLEFLGLLALPTAFVAFPRLADRGYAFSKVLALLLVGYFLWILASFRLLPNARGTILLLLAALLFLSLWLLGRRRQEFASFLAHRWPLLLIEEALFLSVFIFWAVVRLYDPNIAGTEKPMDFAFLNSLLRSDYFPPHDPWLSGHPISYYYFGYLLMSLLVGLTGVPSSLGYNLALILLPALTATAAFSLVYNLVAGARYPEKVPPLSGAALGGGLAAVFLLTLMGNLEGVLEMARAHGLGVAAWWQWVGIRDLGPAYQSSTWYPTDTWWWWRATRVIGTVEGPLRDYTITEFPFFSFLLGDLHPHVMALPFGLLTLALGLNLFLAEKPLKLAWLKQSPWEFGLLALSLGALGFLNSWDFPTYAAILLLAIVLRQALRGEGWWGESLLLAIALVGGALLLYWPFYQGLQTQAVGVLPWRGPDTRPLHAFLFWGPLLFIVASMVLFEAWRRLRRWPPQSALWVGLLLVPWALWSLLELLLVGPGESYPAALQAIASKLWHLFPWLFLLTLLGLLLLRGGRRWRPGEGAEPREVMFVLGLTFLGLSLTMIPELFFLRDLFGNRMNTVFKVYYQAWVLLAIASAFGLFWLSARWQGGVGKIIWRGVLALFLAGAVVYPVAATWSKTGGFSGEPTFDGLAFVKRANPSEYEAIRWLQENIAGAQVILEATGGDYSEYGRVSGRTGLPTLLGWAGHEVQWRGSARLFQGRERDIDEIYRAAPPEKAKQLLLGYNVRYIYFGSLERARYGEGSLERLAPWLEVAFQNSGVTIYKVRPEALRAGPKG